VHVEPPSPIQQRQIRQGHGLLRRRVLGKYVGCGPGGAGGRPCPVGEWRLVGWGRFSRRQGRGGGGPAVPGRRDENQDCRTASRPGRAGGATVARVGDSSIHDHCLGTEMLEFRAFPSPNSDHVGKEPHGSQPTPPTRPGKPARAPPDLPSLLRNPATAETSCPANATGPTPAGPAPSLAQIHTQAHPPLLNSPGGAGRSPVRSPQASCYGTSAVAASSTMRDSSGCRWLGARPRW
jgi:hypothetical protein